jgi:hypothetical protein
MTTSELTLTNNCSIMKEKRRLVEIGLRPRQTKGGTPLARLRSLPRNVGGPVQLAGPLYCAPR